MFCNIYFTKIMLPIPSKESRCGHSLWEFSQLYLTCSNIRWQPGSDSGAPSHPPSTVLGTKDTSVGTKRVVFRLINIQGWQQREPWKWVCVGRSPCSDDPWRVCFTLPLLLYYWPLGEQSNTQWELLTFIHTKTLKHLWYARVNKINSNSWKNDHNNSLPLCEEQV